MGPYLTLQQGSSRQIVFDVAGVPSGAGMSSATWLLKNAYTDADAAALISLTVTASPTAAGVISDSGASDSSGVVNLVIGNTALASLTDLNTTYYALCRVTLANGMIYELPESRQPVRVLA